jgi:hypothetical protein
MNHALIGALHMKYSIVFTGIADVGSRRVYVS